MTHTALKVAEFVGFVPAGTSKSGRCVEGRRGCSCGRRRKRVRLVFFCLEFRNVLDKSYICELAFHSRCTAQNP